MSGSVSVADDKGVSQGKSQFFFYIPAYQYFIRCLRKSSFRDGIGVDLCQVGFVGAADDHVFIVDGVPLIQSVIQGAVAGDRFDLRACADQSGFFIADPAYSDMPVTVLPLCFEDHAPDIHIRHAEDGRHEKD